jgi:enediyne biosynthesis protein E2
MTTTLGVLRRVVPAPTMTDITFAQRGFPAEPNSVSRRIELVPRAVIEGFHHGADHAGAEEIARRLEWIDPEYRSLAYEGAIAALIFRDLLAGGRSRRAEEFVRGAAAPHAMMAYVGCGLVLARLPRWLWSRAIPRFDSDPLLPWLRWLAIDGYGFDKAYFDPKRWVFARAVPKPYPFDGAPDYFLPVFDQGVGRALWFVFGGDAAPIPSVIERFPPRRRADLWSGIGAAATYVGGPSRSDLQALIAASDGYRADMAIGSVSAIKARHHAGFVPDATELAAELICGASIREAVVLADEAAQRPPENTGVPAYMQWRRRIRSQFVEHVDRSGHDVG